jgi:heterodisulfide reductase subunit C
MVKDSDSVEVGNLMEEVAGVFDKCVECGMCKARCGVFRVLRREEFSARGKGILLSRKIMDKICFECNLCRACEEACPLGVGVCEAVLKCRQAMVLKGKGLKANEKLVEMVRETGLTYREGDDGKDRFVCC